MIAGASGTAAYGVWAQAVVVASLGAMLAALGLPNALVRFYATVAADKRRRLVWTALALSAVTGLTVAAIVVALAPLLADTLGRGATDKGAFEAAAVLVPLVAIRLLAVGIGRAQDRLALFSVASSGFDVLDLLLIASALAAGAGVAGALAASGTANAIVTTLLLVHFRRDLGVPRLGGPRALLRYSLPLVPTQLSDEALARGDRLIVGGFLGPSAAGVYAALYALASIPNIVNAAFTNVLFPRLVRVGGPAAAKLVARSTRVFAATTLLLVVALALAAQPLAQLLLGEPQPWGRSAAVVAFAGLGVLFWGIGRITSLHLFLRNRTEVVLVVWAGAAVFNMALNVVLVPRVGIVGAAFASCVAYAAFLLVVFRLTRGSRHTPPPERLVAATRGALSERSRAGGGRQPAQ
jgi:O-antigen/teichoic acid export membrane protein